MTPQEREQLLLHCLKKLMAGEMTEGEVLKMLRKKILGMNQQQYANFVGVSRRTLSDIENDTGSQSIMVINTVFKPIGLRAGLLPTNADLLNEVLSTEKQNEGSVRSQRLSSFKRK